LAIDSTPQWSEIVHYNDAVMLQESSPDALVLNSSAPLLFVINASAGSRDAQVQQQAIEDALQAAGRTGELIFSQPADLPDTARKAAFKAAATHSAIVAVGGDGTINTVAQAAHDEGCAMGVIPQGTFNYFARTHGIPADVAQAMNILLHSAAMPVQVATINNHVFLVNASLGLYPKLLEDREAYKARFGRSRLVAFGAACVTLLQAHRQLRLHIELANAARDVRTSTLFVGNNQLQLEQVGVQVDTTVGEHMGYANRHGRVAAVMLKPMGTLAMLRLMLHGAMGTLGEADNVESFEFDHMVVKPRLDYGRHKVKVAFDGEVQWMRSPIEFAVSPKALHLIKPDMQKASNATERADA
jgi:diacylglycerol kinase family enzyme